MRKEQLLPCPFCGNTRISISDTEGTNDRPYWMIMCAVCGTEKDNNYKSREEAIKCWNTRKGIDHEKG